MRNFYTYLLLMTLFTFGSEVNAQKLLNIIDKTVQGVENVKRNKEKNDEKEQNKPNTKSVAKSNFHQNYMGKIMFAKGTPNSNLEDASQFVQTLDLNQPSYFNAYLPDPLYVLKASKEKLGEYDIVSPHIIRNYYINNQLIASYTDNIDGQIFKNALVFTDVFVPADGFEFDKNKFPVGALAHVFSSLNAGKHKLKVEYLINISEKIPAGNGSAAFNYNNTTLKVAEGEVDVQFTAAELANYTKAYGRPKYNQGVLQNDSKLIGQVSDLIKGNFKKTPVYIYADDNWRLERNYLDRVVSRSVQVYYVYKNDKGRCEVDNLVIKQNYDGQTYYAPVETINTYGKPFKFVVCQNY
ncbi:hypothetical protein [Moheibacter stercoris]|uniref:Uncharacterized protein n=1 Tax=Moheibacter stercoris TaxID=1628251 RepID=A0ABV2LXT9_9FLAO